MADPIIQAADKVIACVMAQREEILEAFIAQYGAEPHQVEQVEQRMEDGSVRWFIRVSDTERPDTRRLRYLMQDGPDGFVHLEKDRYDLAMELAEQAGRSEPNEMDELNGFRLLIDAAMAADTKEQQHKWPPLIPS